MQRVYMQRLSFYGCPLMLRDRKYFKTPKPTALIFRLAEQPLYRTKYVGCQTLEGYTHTPNILAHFPITEMGCKCMCREYHGDVDGPIVVNLIPESGLSLRFYPRSARGFLV